MRVLDDVVGFDWDRANADKVVCRHGVLPSECEQVLLGRPLVYSDLRHSGGESRFIALGYTDAGKPLFVVFTMRGERIRVISARKASRKERKELARHDETQEEDPRLQD